MVAPNRGEWPRYGEVVLTFAALPTPGGRMPMRVPLGVVAAAKPDAAGRYKINVNVTAASGAGPGSVVSRDAGAVFAVPQSATVTMTGPVDAAVRPHDVATSLRRFAERLGGPFAGLSAASRKHLATMCADAAHAIAALMEPRGGSPDGRVQRATDAARAAQHGAAIVASLVILETAGTMLGDEDEWVGQLSFQAAYACGLAAARRAQ